MNNTHPPQLDTAIPVVRWERHTDSWVRVTDGSHACVTDTHQWAAISTVYGAAHGQSPDHTAAMNAARAILRVWGEYSDNSFDDDEHHDDIWARPPQTPVTAWPSCLPIDVDNVGVSAV